MSHLVALITAWDEFAAANPGNATVEAFCNDYLYNEPQKRRSKKQTTIGLLRRISRLAAIQRTCTRLAFRDLHDFEPEWYHLLHAINEEVEVRKTDVIKTNLLLEATTGIDILNRMVKAGLISEEVAMADKRLRLLRLTPKGKTILQKAEQKVKLVSDMLFSPNLAGIWDTVDSSLALAEYSIGPLLAEYRPKSMDELLQLRKTGK